MRACGPRGRARGSTPPGVLIFTQGGKKRARPASWDRARLPFRLSAEHAGCALPLSIALIWSATDSMGRLFSVELVVCEELERCCLARA